MPSGALTTKRLRPATDRADRILVELLEGSAPALVYLHGMTTNRVSAKSSALLDRARRRGQGFARFDFRGHGDSSGELRTLRFSQLIEDTQAVVAEVGPCVLVGSSMGALAAAWTAARHPDDILALVLLSPALGFLAAMASAGDEFLLHRGEQAPIELDPAVLADARKFDESSLAARLTMPVCIIHGSEDTTVPARLSVTLSEAIPHANKELWIIQGGSHSLNEDLEPVLDRIEVFLEGQSLL